jgi:hypothetical protein
MPSAPVVGRPILWNIAHMSQVGVDGARTNDSNPILSDSPVNFVSCALVDSGAEANTMNLRSLLHQYTLINFAKYTSDAGAKKHCSVGQGYFKVIINDDNGAPNHSALINAWHTPIIQHTVMSSVTAAK